MTELKIVVCDLDGTLLNSKREVSIATKKAIEECKDRGIKFLIASGRPLHGIKIKVKEWQIEVDGIIASNGAEVYDSATDETKRNYELQPETLQMIYKRFAPLQMNACVYSETKIHCERSDSSTQRIAKNSSVLEDVGSIQQCLNYPQAKLLYTVDVNKMNEVEQFYNENRSDDYIAFKSQADLFEFIHPHCGKSVGIEEYAKHYDLTLDQCIAFGDTTNDLDMLEHCGLGVCMANGTDDAKNIADDICLSNDEDGIAGYLTSLWYHHDYETKKRN